MKTNSGGKAEAKKGRNRVSWAVGILCGVLVFALAGFFAYVIYGSTRWEGVLPNVYAYGVDLGGMSRSEAEAAIAAELEAPGSGLSIGFSTGGVMELTRADTIAGYDAGAAAEKAWNYGRQSGSISPFSYAFSLSGSVELYEGALNDIDENALRSAIAQKASNINSSLVEGAYSVSGSTLTIVKGVTGFTLDVDEVYQVAIQALKKGETTAFCTPTESSPQPLDLKDIYASVCREPVDAVFDDEFNVTESVPGLSFDLERAQKLYDAAEDGAVISITLSTVEPEVSSEALRALLYRDRLSSWTSSLSGSEVRSTNIELAAEAINGTVLLPGQRFSFNDVVGERTEARGYGPAPAYVGGETVNSVGGGICQVASSIYYCSLMADMDIVYRTCHLYAAYYVPLGMDATISWGGPEFEFANSSEYPVKIVTWRDGNQLFCELYGTKTSGEYIEMTYEVAETYSFETVYQEDESVEPGHTKTQTSGITGYKVISYRSRFAADGTLISSEQEDVSVYSKRNQVILVAPGELHLYDPNAQPSEETPVEATEEASEAAPQ